MNQFPRLTPRTFSPVEKAGTFDPGSVYQTRLDAMDGVATIKVATVAKADVRNMVDLDACQSNGEGKRVYFVIRGS